MPITNLFNWLKQKERVAKLHEHPDVGSVTFRPIPGLSSPHAQTVLACITPAGSPPPSSAKTIKLKDGHAITCKISTPPSWHNTHKTIVLIHGLGGNDTSAYMIRLSRKLYKSGYRAVRVNLRGSGSARDLAPYPYHGGCSDDVLTVIEEIKKETPISPIILIGFSLGGNIALKLAGELGDKGETDLLHTVIAVCPPIDLAETASLLSQPENLFYNRYYMWQLEELANKGDKKRTFNTIYEFDTLVTAPNWGFQNPEEYYQLCSSRNYLSKIVTPCHILFSIDDPFINHESCLDVTRSSSVKVWLSEYGGHMGFFGWVDEKHRYYWLDEMLMKWISENADKASTT